MVDKSKDGMNPRAGDSQSAGNPSMTGGSQNVSGSSNSNNASNQQSGQNKGGFNPSQMAGQAKEQAKNVASQAAEQGKSAINQQKDSVVQQVDSVSGAIRSAADRLQEDGQSQTSQYVGMFADQIESFSRQLRNKDANTLMRDMENLSRRSPVVFFAGALVAGFAAARFMKSSAERSSYEYGSRDSFGGSRMQDSSQDDESYSWRNEMGEGDTDVNVGRNRTQSLNTGVAGSMSDDAASGTLGGQWGAGTTTAGPDITGINRPSEAQSANTGTPGTKLPGSAQPAVSADGKPQPGRPTDSIGGSTKSTSPTEPKKSGGNIHGNR